MLATNLLLVVSYASVWLNPGQGTGNQHDSGSGLFDHIGDSDNINTFLHNSELKGDYV